MTGSRSLATVATRTATTTTIASPTKTRTSPAFAAAPATWWPDAGTANSPAVPVQPGRDNTHANERVRLFSVLAPVTVAAAVALIAWRIELLVPIWVIAAIGAPWIAFSLFLRRNRETYGREGRYVDLWAIAHAVGGALLGLFGIGFVWAAALVIWWELVETACRIPETPQNRVLDIVVALAAWAFAQWFASGALIAT